MKKKKKKKEQAVFIGLASFMNKLMVSYSSAQLDVD